MYPYMPLSFNDSLAYSEETEGISVLSKTMVNLILTPN